MQAYVRFSEVIITSLKGNSKKIPISSRCHIYEASFVRIFDTPYLVLASSLGMQVWTVDGSEMKFFYALSALVDSEEGKIILTNVILVTLLFIYFRWSLYERCCAY